MSARITLKDVARQAGVSYQTVSKVLRNQIQVTPETRTRIYDSVKELGYRPNTAARSLRTSTTYLIGYSWHPSPNNEPNPIQERFLQSIVLAAETHQYHIMLFPWIWGGDFVTTYRELITSNRVDGFILSSIDFDDPRIPFLREMDFPFVTFGRTQSEPNYPYIDVDSRAGTRAAVEHLLEQGHQKIAVLAWPESSRVGSSRLNGYYETMQLAGLQYNEDWIRGTDGTLESAYTNTKALLDLPKQQRPTAIVTMVDIMALGASQAIQEYGYVVGKEIGVTGFDDTSFSRHVRPSLTTLHQPVEEGGAQVMELLMKIIHEEKIDQSHFLLRPELIIRESSLR